MKRPQPAVESNALCYLIWLARYEACAFCAHDHCRSSVCGNGNGRWKDGLERRVHRAVVASGVCFTGPTIQFIDEEYDTGPILAQRVVPVSFSDTPASVAAKVLVEVLPPPLLKRSHPLC